MRSRPTVSERIRGELPNLAPAERRVARTLLGDDPFAGLEPVAALAARARTSAPTVLRLLGKLGFTGYPEFQQAVKEELAYRLSSPLQLYPKARARHGSIPQMLQRLGSATVGSAEHLSAKDLDAAIRLLADGRRPVWTIGGRFSGFIADYLAAHLQLLRPLVNAVPTSPADRVAALLDIDARAVVVAFDYRRYQRDTIEFGQAASAQDARLLLLTDQYLSPLAAHARIVLCTNVDSPSPFDVLTPAVALVESLVAAVVDRLGDVPRERIARYESLGNQVIR